MDDKLSQIFKNISQIEPPIELKGIILGRIKIEKARQIKKKMLFSYFGMIASFSAAVYTLVHFGNAFFKSEFWSILSLIFSDAQIVVGYWKTYGYSLLETLPVLNIIAVLIPIFMLLIFFNLLVSLKNKKYIHRNFNLHTLHH